MKQKSHKSVTFRDMDTIIQILTSASSSTFDKLVMIENPKKTIYWLRVDWQGANFLP